MPLWSNKPFLVVWFCAIVLLTCCYGALAQTPDPGDGSGSSDNVNLVINPGFEDGVQGWGGGNFGGKAHRDLDTEVYRSGRSSLRVTTYGKTDQGNNDRIAVTLSPRPSVNAGEMYRFEGWVKTDLIGGSTYLRLGLRNIDNQNVGSLVRSNTLTGRNDWTYLQATFTIPETVVALHAELYSEGGEGAVWWDDIGLYLVEKVDVDGENLISNPKYLGEPDQVPTDWIVFGTGKMGENLFVIEDENTGERVFMIDDLSDTMGYGLRSNYVPVEPGQIYRATAMARASDGGSASFYLDYLDANRRRVLHRAVGTRSDQWTPLSITMEAPDEAVWVTTILYSTTDAVGRSYFKDVELEKRSGDRWRDEDIDQVAGDDQLTYSPADGSVATTNPPSFVWIPIEGATSYTLEYSTDPSFNPEHTVVVDDIDMSVYTPSETFNTNETWYWRVHGVDRRGRTSDPTVARAFRISPQATVSPLPPLDEVRGRIPQSHPRLFVTSDKLDAWREKAQSDAFHRTRWAAIRSQALGLVHLPPPDEPPHPSPGGVWDVNLWREYSITVRATDNMEALAFAYMMTGDPELGEAARRWMLHIASWDPRGATSWAANSESAMPILLKMGRAYTWAYDALSEEDRAMIQDVMRIRGSEVYRLLRARPFESRPYASHPGRVLGFLGEAAIAFMGDIPEASDWFDYVVRIFYAVYPAWGRDPGGWAEGHAYWTSYMNRVLWFVDALRESTGLNLYEKAFFQNTGMFKLYTHPPYSKIGPFGDFADRGPSSSDGTVMGHFAQVYGNPYYEWYAQQLGAVVEGGVMGYIRMLLYPRGQVTAKAPTDLPASAYFPDVGWVAMHKKLGEPRDAIQLMFKSSPYGSFSHSLADQNTFTLEAYGTPLAISSGYRPWYGSTHHMQWTKATQAHNGILVDGHGQIPQSLSAKGEVVSFIQGDTFDYTAGDAAAAYGGRLDRYVRHVVYVRPDVFVLFDDLEASRPSTYSWLLHAYHQMNIDDQAGYIGLDAGTASLDVRLRSSRALTYHQTDEFAVPLDEPMNKPVQWHLTATTADEAERAYFLSVLTPSKAGARRAVTSEEVALDGGVGVRISDADDDNETLILFRQGDSESSEMLSTDELAVLGGVGAMQRQGKDRPVSGLLLIDGTLWKSSDGIILMSSTELDAELTIIRSEDGTSVEINGTLISPSGPGAESFGVTLTFADRIDVESVTSSNTIERIQIEGGCVRLHLAPGAHDVTIQARSI